MKNIISLMAILLLLGITAKGQDDDYQKYKLGFKLSPNVSWMVPKDNEIESSGSLLKMGFGLIFDFHFTENYAIGTGINVSYNGGELNYLTEVELGDDRFIADLERQYNLQNLEIPITVKMRSNEIGYITYWGQFGIGLSAHIGSNADDEYNYLYEQPGGEGSYMISRKDGETVDDEDIEDDIRLFRAAMIVSAGIEYSLGGNTAIIAGVTFNNGFTNILKNKGVDRSDDNPDLALFNDPNNQAEPYRYDLDAINNYVELNIGVMF